MSHPGTALHSPRKESPSLLVPSVASLLPPPPPSRPCHLGRGQQGPPSLHLTTWVQGERRRKPSGLHFLKSSFVSNKAETFRPGSLSQLIETQRQEECDFHSDLSSRLGAPETVSSLYLVNKIFTQHLIHINENCSLSVNCKAQ